MRVAGAAVWRPAASSLYFYRLAIINARNNFQYPLKLPWRCGSVARERAVLRPGRRQRAARVLPERPVKPCYNGCSRRRGLNANASLRAADWRAARHGSEPPRLPIERDRHACCIGHPDSKRDAGHSSDLARCRRLAYSRFDTSRTWLPSVVVSLESRNSGCHRRLGSQDKSHDDYCAP
jgi:hypothetical protein